MVVVDKIRNKFMYLNKYEIALDQVKELGYFVEIEVKEYESTPLEEYDSLLKVAKGLHFPLENLDKVGYPYHLLININKRIN